MRLTFSTARWRQVVESHEAWWRGELGRPLVNLYVRDAHDIGSEPELPLKHFTGNYDPQVPPEQIVDRWDWELARREYVADGYPSIWPNFGPGVVAAFLGCITRSRETTIWFEPSERVPASELKLEPGFESPTWKRLVSIYETAIDYFGSSVQLGMTDLGGNLDILQSFLPGEELALALYDSPEDVKRLTWEAHDAWWTYFDELDRMLKDTNPGYTAWAPILSKDPHYMLQCDFAYMIGPAMFDEFVRPELEATCKRLVHPFYHLDGTGQIPHLQSLLGIEELSGVQWIPGDGAPNTTQWPELYRDIIKADRKTQVSTSQSEAGVAVLDVLKEQLGSLDNVILIGDIGPHEVDQARAVLERHGVPW